MHHLGKVQVVHRYFRRESRMAAIDEAGTEILLRRGFSSKRIASTDKILD